MDLMRRNSHTYRSASLASPASSLASTARNLGAKHRGSSSSWTKPCTGDLDLERDLDRDLDLLRDREVVTCARSPGDRERDRERDRDRLGTFASFWMPCEVVNSTLAFNSLLSGCSTALLKNFKTEAPLGSLACSRQSETHAGRQSSLAIPRAFSPFRKTTTSSKWSASSTCAAKAVGVKTSSGCLSLEVMRSRGHVSSSMARSRSVRTRG
mmetsp:Transcript_15750/g.41500  ORF Transcript_15750/g.41500 Transcript_15750/m.41500 type:complete len:211 (-) Transcript_15750:319-951(-)